MQFSIGELVDKLISTENSQVTHLSSVVSVEQAQAYYSSREAQALYAKFPSSSKVRALRGIVSGLTPTDMQKTAKDWESERISEKYDA